MSVRLAWHEAGHALIARSLGRRVESVSIGPGGGAVREEPLAPNGTDEEIESSLAVVFAGLEAERYAPSGPERNGDSPWFTPEEVAMLEAEPVLADGPSDDAVVEHYESRLGAEAVERARELSRELVMREHVIGRLGQLAGELLWRHELTGPDLERLLEASA
jgi:hypothetical protein